MEIRRPPVAWQFSRLTITGTAPTQDMSEVSFHALTNSQFRNVNYLLVCRERERERERVCICVYELIILTQSIVNK
jgi:hypothetical protein